MIERYEIIRRYFQAKKVDFGIVTEKQIPIIKCKNIEWIHSSLRLGEENGIAADDIDYLCNMLVHRIKNNEHLTVRKITSNFDEELNIDSGTGLLIFKHLIATRQIIVNMNENIDVNKPSNYLIKSIDIERREMNKNATNS